jgi:cytochrome b pre-mRNA-processing protein 3
MLSRLLRRSRLEPLPLYGAIVAAARRPELYAVIGVPDTLDGRFDMVVLHLVSVMRRLRLGGDEAMVQALADLFVTDMDRSLREMGVGDITVPKRVKKMAQACYGRLAAYVPLIAHGDVDGLSAAIHRNVFPDGGSEAAATALARMMIADAAALDAAETTSIASGAVPFTAVQASEGV